MTREEDNWHGRRGSFFKSGHRIPCKRGLFKSMDASLRRARDGLGKRDTIISL